MYKIMFICHGNICRSPMAEFIMKHLLDQQGRIADFIVVSAATSSEEIYRGVGNPVYPPALKELKKRGIPTYDRRAVKLQRCDYVKYDVFYCMDSNNFRNTVSVFGGDPDNKVKMLLSDKDVSDPWYTNRFDIAYNDIFEGCNNILLKLNSL